MSRINISIPAMKLSKIDFYCKENKINRSKLLVMGAMAIVNSSKGERCSLCSNEAIGKFKVEYYEEATGMNIKEVYLCEFHKKKNEERNEVSEI